MEANRKGTRWTWRRKEREVQKGREGNKTRKAERERERGTRGERKREGENGRNMEKLRGTGSE